MARLHTSLRRWIDRGARPHAAIAVAIGVLLIILTLFWSLGTFHPAEDELRTAPTNAELPIVDGFWDVAVDTRTPRIYVSLPGDGRILIDENAVSLAELEQRLTGHLRSPGNSPTRALSQSSAVYFRAAAHATWGEVASVLQVAAEAGVIHIDVATRGRESPRWTVRIPLRIVAFPNEPPAGALHTARIEGDGSQFRGRNSSALAQMSRYLRDVYEHAETRPVFLRIHAEPDTRWDSVVVLISAARFFDGVAVAP